MEFLSTMKRTMGEEQWIYETFYSPVRLKSQSIFNQPDRYMAMQALLHRLPKGRFRYKISCIGSNGGSGGTGMVRLAGFKTP